MFLDLSWSHLFLVLIVALLVVGPKDLPKMMRQMGRWTGKAREMASQLRRSFDDMARQSELDELRSEIESLRRQQPLADIDQSLHQKILPELHEQTSAPGAQAEMARAPAKAPEAESRAEAKS